MSTLKVNKLRDTAGSADAIVLDPNGGAVLAGVTTVTSVKVGAAVTISESGIEASGIGITCANINGTQIGGRRNIIINGDMQIAQRSTSSTDVNYGSVDRWTCQQGGLDEACTQAQVDVAEGTSPYGLGHRKAWKITNGNQTSGAGAADYIEIYQYIEGHNMATCGWDYKNPNSKMTLSFWIKSSVAQKFAGFLYTTLANGTSVGYMYDYSIDNGGSNLTADTWTKITHTFSGNSNLNITNGPNYGLGFGIYVFQGTDYTTSRSPSEAWQTWATSNKVPDMTSTWYETNDATLEITGVQLEVGSQATAFEHRSLAEELTLCQRYFYVHLEGNNKPIGNGTYWSTTSVYCPVFFPVKMRTAPSAVFANDTINNWYGWFRDGTANYEKGDNWSLAISGTQGAEIYDPAASGTTGYSCFGRTQNASSKITFSAEL